MLRVPVHSTGNGYVFDNVYNDFDLKHFDYNLTGDRKNGKMEMIMKVLKKKEKLKIVGEFKGC